MSLKPTHLPGILKRLWIDRRGATAMTFGLLASVLFGLAGGAIDISNLLSVRVSLQNAADTAALAGAKEFRLSNAAEGTAISVARTYAASTIASKNLSIENLTISPSVNILTKSVTVAIRADVSTFLIQVLGSNFVHIDVASTAHVTGGPPICAIGLDSAAKFTISLDKNARIEAPLCSVYSNSTAANGLMAKDNAAINAAFICSAGGKSGAGPGSFTPTPQTDCPMVADPLASRPSPTAGGCLQMDLVISGGIQILQPGTYCGGITIKNLAIVTLLPGVYVMKDGPLLVTGNGTLTGVGVGIYFTGNGAVMNFDTLSNVNLTAPLDGVMAGMLMFEDRNSPTGQVHQIISNNARVLLGTIYLPQNRLHVAALLPVSDLSAYTILVVRMFTLSEGPIMFLNANYGGTKVPVPEGVGLNANQTLLSQ